MNVPRRRGRSWFDLRLGLLLAVFALLLAALAGLTATLPRDVYRYLFVIDITQSMNVQDAGPRQAPLRRLEASKAAVRLALQRLPCGSEAGLAVFTEYRAFTLFAPVEVCEHYSGVTTMLDDIDWPMAWAARSEVAKGLYSSLLAARDLGDDTRLVFLSDGHEAPPLHPEILPRYAGTPGEVAGVIVGVGALEPVPIPHLGADGRIVGYWKSDEVQQIDPFSLGRSTSVAGEPMVGIDSAELARRIATGTEHLSALRESHLRQLAEQTRLDYHRLESARGFAEFLIRPQLAHKSAAATDLRWVAGALAILLVVLVYLGNARKSSSRLPALLLPCVLVLAAAGGSDAFGEETYTRERISDLLAGGSADLARADLRGLDLSGLDFRGVNLRGADLSQASLRNCNLDLAILREAVLVGADLRDASMFSTVLAEATMTKADLTGARLVGNLTGANLEGAILTDVNGGADMRNQPMGLMRAVLAQARLKGANLVGADLSRADLSFADLREADLSRANLMRADLSGANLAGAQLANAVMTEADIENADFRGARGIESVRGFESTVGRELATFD